jgi:hypothetical protein
MEGEDGTVHSINFLLKCLIWFGRRHLARTTRKIALKASISEDIFHGGKNRGMLSCLQR